MVDPLIDILPILLQDILLIVGSVLVFSAEVTPLQVVGYSIALGGLILYKTSK